MSVEHAGFDRVEIDGKINVKGDGQECPSHTVVILTLLFTLFSIRFAAGQTAVGTRTLAAPAAKTFRIGGAVVNALTGEILPHAVVTMGRSEAGDALQSVVAGDDGGFRFEGVAAGKYWLRAHARGFVDQAFDEHEGFSTGIVAGAAMDAEHLMFRLPPAASIAGQIVDEANEPVREAQVMLFRRHVQGGREVTTWSAGTPVNDEGRYRFKDLVPGTYFVVVQAKPWYARDAVTAPRMVFLQGQGDSVTSAVDEAESSSSDPAAGDRTLDVAYPLTYYPGATDESGAAPVVIKAGDRATADIRMNAVPALRVQVHKPPTAESGAFGARLSLRIFGGPEMQPQSQATQIRKRDLELSGVAPGEYELRVDSFGKTQESWTQHVVLTTDTDVSVSEHPTLATVKGTIKLEGGATPAEQWFVQFVNRATGEQMNAPVTEKGEFEFGSQNIAPGTYEVIMGNTGARVSQIAATGAKVLGQNVEISGAGPVQLTISLREGLGRVNGTVVREGKGVAGAMVVLVPQDVGNNIPLVRRDQSDMDGTFSLRDVLPGKYTVVAIHDGWDMDWMDTSVLSPLLKNGETVDVRADGKYEVKVGVQ